MKSIAPIVKWAGGKRWLLRQYPELFPNSFDRLVEPFLGGASVFLALLPKRALLADINNDLITMYKAIRDNWQPILNGLRFHNNMHSKQHYYSVRSEKPKDPVSIAIRFLYLNRTCWNGLYRVNKRGIFNVPIGTKSKVVLPTDDLPYLSNILNNNVTLECQDFMSTLKDIHVQDFVYIDPPYTVNHSDNGFIKYNETLFSWHDQMLLRDSVDDAAAKGAKIIVSQANHDSIRELYHGIGTIRTVSRHSVLASKKEFRKSVEELIISINL